MKETDKIMAEQVKRLRDTLRELNRVYEDYARSVNIPYTTLHILTLITQMENCTQKAICERTFLPKQTVSNVITLFYKQGIVELKEVSADRRNKTIHLTKSGQQFADSLIPQIQNAEYEAMEKLTPKQRQALIEGIKIYGETFRQAMPARENNS
ncbi:MAG: MarR family transcriptional regulator [Spirochaetaceae bacterium]|jgi:DNA-binding MarR family transcriptional regulator|nr:MarR family transcriptional regulator [Spirochaetaceae bacterium]